MKLTARDWQVLRLPLIGLGVVVLLALLLTAHTGATKDAAWQALQAQQSQFDQARNRFQTSGSEKEMIARYLPLYLELVQQGFIGEERRIEWIDDLRTINQQYKLFGIHYSIGAQEARGPALSMVTGPFALHRSVMKIEMGLLHENDLLAITDALSSHRRAPFLLRDCIVSRSTEGNRSQFLPNLNASCEIEWLTIAEPPRAGGTP